MPVLFDSASSGATYINPSATSGTVTASSHNVSPTATNVVAIACIIWTGGVDTTGATFGATFGGQTMTASGSAVRWNSNKEFMQWYVLVNPPTGPQTVLGTYSGMGTESFNARAFMVVAATYANVASVGTATVVTPTNTNVNSVTVASVLPAHRVVTAHGAGNGVFNVANYSKTLRASAALNQQLLAAGASLMLGDAPGAASVTVNVDQNTTTSWGARGLSLAPTPVIGGATLNVSVTEAASGGTYRTATPAEERYYVIPHIGAPDDGVIAGDFVEGADGVRMPIWVKDPNDVEDYTLDWSNILVDGDQIISATFTTSSPALTVFSTNIADSPRTERENAVTSCWFTGAVASVNYGVVCHITTAEGRQHDRTFRIVGGQK